MDIRRIFDVDIDLPSHFDKKQFGYTQAMIYNEDALKIQPHPSGFYLEEVPVDNITGLCSFDYEYGDEQGFMKVDLLTNRVYDKFKTKKDVLDCISDDNIDWSVLEDSDFVATLPHIGKHVELVQRVAPTSVIELADILALIRPAKIHLVNSYIKNKDITRKRLYLRPSEGIYFKKSHAISYALMIVCAMSSKQGAIKW